MRRWWIPAPSLHKDIDLFQYADSPEQAFELLKKGLTEHHLVAEAAMAAAAQPESKKPLHNEDLMAGLNMDDFLGPSSPKLGNDRTPALVGT